MRQLTRKKDASPVFVRSDDQFKNRLAKAAALTNKPMSQLVREAVDEKLEKLAKKHPELEAA